MGKLGTNMKLLIALAVLAGLAAVKALSGGRYGDEETAQASEELFAGFKKEDVAAIVIAGPDGKRCELAKSGDAWSVVTEGGGKADKTLVDKVLGAVDKLEQGRVISEKGELARYGLEGAGAIDVALYGGGGTGSAPLARFLVGKIENDWRNVFLKLPDQRAVRKVEGSASDFQPGTGDSWRDKSMYEHGETDKVARVEVTGPNGTVALAREKVMGEKAVPEGEPPPETPELEVKETVWNLESPKTGRAKKWLCDSIAGYAAKLEANAFHTGKEGAAELGLEPPQYTLRVQFEGESEAKTVLLIGNKNNEGKYACKLPDRPELFWIEGWKGDYLVKSADDLLDAPPPAAPSDEAAPGEAGDDGAGAGASDAPAPEGDAAPAEGSSGDAGDGGATPPATDPASAGEGGGSAPEEPAGDGDGEE